ncbi:hypothetical protein [Thalassolituus sp. UBA1505]|uniref:hypothetical protein n=1 Tax=Thalassolituus sp. UBA1505 TaxID=1947653 RepID=UPI0025D83A65|nr:hypothetical protein [Thalassolituus sp. UBA1505]
MVQIAVAFLALRTMTSLLSEEEVARYYTLLSVFTLLNFAFLNGPGQFYNRKIVKLRDSGKLFSGTMVLLMARLVLTILALLTCFLIYYLFSFDAFFTIEAFLLVVLVTLVSGTSLVLINAINILGYRLYFVQLNTLYLLLGLLAAIIIVNLYSNTAVGWALGLAFGQLIIILPAILKIKKLNQLSNVVDWRDRSVLKKALKFCIPIVATLFLQWGNNSFYRFAIGDLYSIDVLAGIAVGLAVSMSIFGAFESLVNQYYLPMFYQEIAHADLAGRSRIFNSFFQPILSMYAALAIFVAVFSQEILFILVDSKFGHVWVYVSIGACIEFFRASSNVLYWVSQSEESTVGTTFPYLAGFLAIVASLYLIDVGTFYWLIPAMIALCSLIVFIMMYFFMGRLFYIDLSSVNFRMILMMSVVFLAVRYSYEPVNIYSSILFLVLPGGGLLLQLYMSHRDFIRRLNQGG